MLSWLLDWLLALLRLLLRVGALCRMASSRCAIVAMSSSSSSSASAVATLAGISSCGRLGVVGVDTGLRFSPPPFSSPFILNFKLKLFKYYFNTEESQGRGGEEEEGGGEEVYPDRSPARIPAGFFFRNSSK